VEVDACARLVPWACLGVALLMDCGDPFRRLLAFPFSLALFFLLSWLLCLACGEFFFFEQCGEHRRWWTFSFSFSALGGFFLFGFPEKRRPRIFEGKRKIGEDPPHSKIVPHSQGQIEKQCKSGRRNRLVGPRSKGYETRRRPGNSFLVFNPQNSTHPGASPVLINVKSENCQRPC